MRFTVLGIACAAMLVHSAVRAAPFECLIQPNQIIDIRSRAEGLIGKVSTPVLLTKRSNVMAQELAFVYMGEWDGD